MMITKICDMKKGNKKGIVALAGCDSSFKPVFLKILFLKIIAISRLQITMTFVTDNQIWKGLEPSFNMVSNPVICQISPCGGFSQIASQMFNVKVVPI